MVNRIIIAIAILIVLISATVFAYAIMSPRTASIVDASGVAMQTAQTTTDSGISVSGTGSVRVKPNLATTSIGVETTAATLAEAVSQSNTKMSAVIEKIKSLGVAEKDIQTTAFNVFPVTNSPRQGEPPRITGYRVNNQVSITIRKTDDVGKIGGEILKKERAFNEAAGLINKHDRMPEFMKTEPLPPHNQVFDVPDAALDSVYGEL